MGSFPPDEVNFGFEKFCPELNASYVQYPMRRDRWLNFGETFQGEPTYIAAAQDEGLKKGYVYCKRAPKGPGYYHVLCKTSYVNLYTRLMAHGPPRSGLFRRKKVDPREVKAFDMARRVIYGRSRCSRPDDIDAIEQQLDHVVGTKLNPLYGIK